MSEFIITAVLFLIAGAIISASAWVNGYSYGIEDRFGVLPRIERNQATEARLTGTRN